MNFLQIFAFLAVQVLLANAVDTEDWFRAVKAGDSATVKRMLTQNGTELLSRKTGYYEMSAIHYASKYGHRDVLKTLIDAGANIDETNKYQKNTALHYAVCNASSELIQLLIDAGANLEATRADGKTALFVAVRSSPVEVVQVLVSSGANIEARNKYGEPVLQEAVYFAPIEVVQVLLDAGVNTEATNSEGETALHVAAHHASSDVVQLLLEAGANIEATTSFGRTALSYHATQNVESDVLRVLVDAGANLEATDKRLRTSLHYAAESSSCANSSSQSAKVQILVDAGADLEAVDNNESTALRYAVWVGPVEKILPLVIAGARADTLQLLIQPNTEQSSELVLRVEVGMFDRNYPLPPYWNGQHISQIVLKLIVAGARADIRQLLAYLDRENDIEFIQQLTDVKKVLPTAVDSNNVEYIEFLVENGKVIEVYNSSGAKTELYWALLHSSMEVLLMEYVDWNAQLEYHKPMYNSISIPNVALETTKSATGNVTVKDQIGSNDQQLEVIYCNNLTPGLRRFVSGIDITTLDLFPLDSTELDGFKKPLLDYTCNKGRTWKDDDNVFDLPDQINSLQRVPTGWTHANTEIFKSRDEVKKSMAKNVHLEESSGTNIDLKTPKFDFFGINIPSFQLKLHETEGSFSRTHSVRKISENIELHEKTIAKATSFISIYKAMIDAKSHFEPSQPLRLAIDNLPYTVDYYTMPLYIEFIKEYGTHFFTEAKFGGYLMQISAISSVYASKHSDEQLKEKETTFFEEKLEWMNKENSKSSEITNDQSEANEEFRKNVQAKMYFYGGDPRAQNLEWFDTVSGSPWLFSGKLEPIYKLIEDEQKQQSMMRALESYMKNARAAEMGPRFDAEVCAFAFGDGCSAPRENCARVNQWTVPVTFREENGSQCRMNWKLKVASPENWMEQGVKLCFKYSAHTNSNCSGSDHHPTWKIETQDKVKTLLSSPATDNETQALINCADVNDWTSKYIHYIGEGCTMTWSMFAFGNEGDDIPEWMEEFYFCWRTLTFEGKYNVDCAPVINRYLSHFYKEGGQIEGRQIAWGLFAQDLSTEV